MGSGGAANLTFSRPEISGALVQSEQGGTVPLSRPWLWKYGVAFSRNAKKPDAWILCPGPSRKAELNQLREKLGKSNAISLSRYLFPKEFEKYGLPPTHHWVTEKTEITSGFCLTELKRAQKEFAKRATKEQRKTVVMKFSDNYGECYVVQEEAIAAAKSGIPVIGSTIVIKFLRSLKIPPMNPYLHEVDEWFSDHPLPFAFGGLTLLQGIAIVVSLQPQGANIKLVGCSGWRGLKGKAKKDPEHMKWEANKLRDTIRMLSEAGPGWEVTNCDSRSEYVKLGAMSAVTCGDGREEYDLSGSPDSLSQLAQPTQFAKPFQPDPAQPGSLEQPFEAVQFAQPGELAQPVGLAQPAQLGDPVQPDAS